MTSAGTSRRVVGYCRVSTREQAENGYGLDSQRQGLADFCRREGYELAEVFEDGGKSGDLPLAERDGLLASLVYAEERRDDPLPIAGVVVDRFDRLGRDTLESLLAEREFNRCDVAVLCAQGANGEDPQTKFMRTVLMAAAELDKAMLLARMANGKKMKAKRGGYAGGKPPLGWRAEGKELVRDEVACQVVRRIFVKVARDSYTLRQLEEEMNVAEVLGRRWSAKGLRAVLRREAYKLGEDPVVDPRVWNRANRVLSERNTRATA
jgi:site-specific DNA recombinase